MKILHATAEYFPYIKMGGLSDMLASLSKEQSQNHQVSVTLPQIRGLKEKPDFTGKTIPILPPFPEKTNVVLEILKDSCFREAEKGRLKLYFFDSPLFRDLETIYGNSDEHFRFAVYSYAAFYLSQVLDADVFHAHDWHTAMAPVLQKYSPEGKPSVFTIHNLAYQGDHPLWMTGFLKEAPFLLHPEFLLHEGKTNYLKAGLLSADQITTVSPGYREETLLDANGFGLAEALRRRSEDYTGIINGIDPEEWNPSNDIRIFERFDRNTNKEGKLKNKIELYKEIGRPLIDPDRSLVGIIGRLTYQKGYSVFLQSFQERKHLSHYYIFQGAGEKDLENPLFHLSHTEQDRIYFYKGYSEELARKIEAASDFFLMPSLFEPCGLNQLYSHAYGTIPIVSRVGGLKDTVVESSQNKYYTGIVFEPNDPSSLGYALERAETLYKDKIKFYEVRENIMKQDWSWKNRMGEYETVYKRAIAKRK
ncbi:glycogen/starch synthase [Leptospira kobayashii]|nr:glycogen/starch synthase [Leptospira kobayashii]